MQVLLTFLTPHRYISVYISRCFEGNNGEKENQNENYGKKENFSKFWMVQNNAKLRKLYIYPGFQAHVALGSV